MLSPVFRMHSTTHHFDSLARLPEPGDNTAIAIHRIERGTVVDCGGTSLTIAATVMEGHRFAVGTIPAGQPLLSWGLPFGLALREITPGDYVCNEKGLVELRHRRLDFDLPKEPNFKDHRIDFRLDEAAFQPAAPVPRATEQRTFEGFRRAGSRGVGTRNFIVVMGTSSRTGSFARALAGRFSNVSRTHPNIDGVVPVAHTEGGGEGEPNNLEFTLRTLAGFLVHPNVVAVLAVDLGNEPVTNARLREFILAHGYPLKEVTHRFMSLGQGFEAGLHEGEGVIRSWLAEANACVRSPQPVSALKLALQCGGSDAFSGVSGNPLAGWVAKEIIRHGGSANLAETSELIGAEPYVLAKVRDLETARKFLRMTDRFQEWAGWHGHSAEGNPSGGNLYRGLYNIIIKSIGAARKKDPEVRLDYCIDYSEPMTAPGYYFMDSPGNDLESIAGQVAAGCNVIHFITGNGSITNFPFVPTVKLVTTTGRFELLRKEMDVNAGRYLDGVPMAELGAECFEHTLRIAAGERSVGEQAGHSQVQLWRDWAQTDASQLPRIERLAKPAGVPLQLDEATVSKQMQRGGLTADQLVAVGAGSNGAGEVGLIVPTSLCAGQIALMIAGKLNTASRATEAGPGVFRYVALPHTEGCGVSRGEGEELYLRTMTGYLRHPAVRRALLLEHGCEKTHNDEMRTFMAEQGVDASRLGFASIQMDGGIDSVTAKVMRWFQTDASPGQSDGLGGEKPAGLRLGIVSHRELTETLAQALASVAGATLSAGGTVVCAGETDGVGQLLGVPGGAPPTLAYGQVAVRPGLHLMDAPSRHLLETITGLGATGVELVIAVVTGGLPQAHPLVPVLNLGLNGQDLDLKVEAGESAQTLAGRLVGLIVATRSRRYTPRGLAGGNTDFQVTRGRVGVSL